MQDARSAADRQLPIADEIFLDHVGHFVRDPEAATRALVRAGFAPTPVSIQVNPAPDGAPRLTGTGNTTAMFARGYIEALFHTADTPLGRELTAAMGRYPGVHLAAFAVPDAATAHRRLTDAGFHMQPLVQMERPVDTGGAPGTAAFTLARVQPGEMPEGRIQILTHRTEAMVWQPRWLSHPNGAVALTSITVVAADVGEATRRFARFTGRDPTPSQFGQMIELDRGRVELVSCGRLRTASAGNPDPFAALHGRLRNQGDIAGRDRRSAAARRHCDPTERARTGGRVPRGAWARGVAVCGMSQGPGRATSRRARNRLRRARHPA